MADTVDSAPVPATKAQKRIDFAEAVRDKAAAEMALGNLEVTTRDGLTAQKMLDDREAKDADRKLMLTIARMLGSEPVPLTLVVGATPLELGSGEVSPPSGGEPLDYEDAELVP